MGADCYVILPAWPTCRERWLRTRVGNFDRRWARCPRWMSCLPRRKWWWRKRSNCWSRRDLRHCSRTCCSDSFRLRFDPPSSSCGTPGCQSSSCRTPSRKSGGRGRARPGVILGNFVEMFPIFDKVSQKNSQEWRERAARTEFQSQYRQSCLCPVQRTKRRENIGRLGPFLSHKGKEGH